MHHAVQDDRLWFHRHPTEVVRFRESAKGEFAPLTQHGETPPAFRPSCSRTGAPLQWVAVVDLMQLLGTSTAVPNDPGVRLRLQTPAIPLAEHRLAAKQELMEAVDYEKGLSHREHKPWLALKHAKVHEGSSGLLRQTT